MHYFNFNIGDYASHTRHLSLLEDLAYRRLLDAYYLGEKPLQGEIELVARSIGMREHEAEVEYVLTLFFESTPDGFINKRADLEIAKYHEKQELAVKAGKASALARFNKRSTSVQPTNNQEPITNKQINTNTPEGVSDLVWKDFKKLREKHKAPITETALKGLRREAEKAKLSLEAVMQMCCERGWRGFKAEWVIQEAQKAKELPLGTEQQIEEAYRVECGGDPRMARFNSYFEMKKFILDQRDKRKSA